MVLEHALYLTLAVGLELGERLLQLSIWSVELTPLTLELVLKLVLICHLLCNGYQSWL